MFRLKSIDLFRDYRCGTTISLKMKGKIEIEPLHTIP